MITRREAIVCGAAVLASGESLLQKTAEERSDNRSCVTRKSVACRRLSTSGDPQRHDAGVRNGRRREGLSSRRRAGQTRVRPGHDRNCWGYNGQTPGPTIEAVEGDRVRIFVTNHLPEPTTLHWQA